MSTTVAPANAKLLIAPCVWECPANIDVPWYIGYVERGQFAEAKPVVMERSPFPAICGNVCYRTCEPWSRRHGHRFIVQLPLRPTVL